MHKHIRVSRVEKHLKACQGWSRRKSDCTTHPKCEKRGTIVSVHRTILTAVLQRSVAAHARTALAESVGSEDVSGAAAASPDVTATNREGCAATWNLSVNGRGPIYNPVHAGTQTIAPLDTES
jgi:hypothetical protein